MVLGLLCALAAAGLFGAAAVVQAVAVRRSGLVSPLMLLVGLAYLAGWAMHLVAISRLPLYLAQMAVGGSLAVTALIASRVVHEPLERRHWAAIGAVVVGFALLVVSALPLVGQPNHPALTPALYLTWAVLGVAGLLTWRRRGPRSGVLLGLLAGLSYAGSPVATRVIDHPALDVRTTLPAIAVCLFGVTGFVLQSSALERVSVTAASAPMVLVETFLPALVGVLLFADPVRPGWTPAALAGFVLATAGAVVLTGTEGRLEHVDGVEPLPADVPDTMPDDLPAGPGLP